MVIYKSPLVRTSRIEVVKFKILISFRVASVPNSEVIKIKYFFSVLMGSKFSRLCDRDGRNGWRRWLKIYFK